MKMMISPYLAMIIMDNKTRNKTRTVPIMVATTFLTLSSHGDNKVLPVGKTPDLKMAHHFDLSIICRYRIAFTSINDSFGYRLIVS
jgi:hypothetical protein